MKLLVLDGNSILNRAFYGIKLLTTKDGQFTNAIYGFLNILLRLLDATQPDGVAVAFDVREPTFRHKMYDEYKAGRKGMPPELAQQLPVLKELLTALGYPILEAPGWEADDILGTLARTCREQGQTCFIATGDRDSLQLAHGGVKVLLASTKMGQPVTTVYDEAAMGEEYGVTPQEMIQVKALMGDASDHIPGVAGVGQKTALTLIQKFHTLDAVYEHLEDASIRPALRAKLEKDRENAYLSLQLGTIATDAPISKKLETYLPKHPEDGKAVNLLASLEMFGMIDKFHLNRDQLAADAEQTAPEPKKIALLPVEDGKKLLALLQKEQKAYLIPCMEQGRVEGMYIPFGDAVYLAASAWAGWHAFCAALFSDKKILKSIHNTKPFYALALRLGVELNGVEMDTYLCAYLLNPSASSYDLERLEQEYQISAGTAPQVPEEQQAAVSQAAAFPSLCETMKGLMEEKRQTGLLHDIEIPLAGVLASMEEEGFLVDLEGIEEFGRNLQTRIDELVDQIYQQVGHEFNINSPKQLGAALFEKLLLPAKKKTKTGYSTNAEVLESLRYEHPVVEMVLEYRTLSKLKSTYCDGLAKVVAEDGRIHSSFNQAETRTGRISSAEPNLQNIPVRSELGKEMRRFFLAKEGCILVDADYSQIELRVLADLADDQTMIQAFNENQDIHAITASQVFHMPLELVTPLMRSRAKAVNFGIVYGIGAFSLSKDIGVSRKEAQSYIDGYLAHYEGVRDYMQKKIEEAKEAGYAVTLFGRRRYLPELTASNANLRAFGERVARNMPIQGTAADIIKIAMVQVHRKLKEAGLQSKLILQVHDELIVEAPMAEAQAAAKIVEEEMEAACKMKVKLMADVHLGKTWYDAKG